MGLKEIVAELKEKAIVKLQFSAKMFDQAFGRFIPPLSTEQKEQLKNTQHNETKFLLHIMKMVYDTELPSKLKKTLINMILLYAYKCDNDEKTRQSLASIIAEIKQY